jgi:hypothetical protein
MATTTQRAIAILDALLNGTATASQRQRLLDAYLFQLSTLKPNATVADAAALLINDTRHAVLIRLKAFESSAAVNAASTQVETDFAEIP